MKIPFIDLAKNYHDSKKEIDLAINGVLESGNYILGNEVSSFEKEFASYLAIKYAVGVASGTDALILALKALDLQKTDEVIIPANSYPTAFAVAQVASIKLVDIDLKTSNLDPKKIEAAVTSKTKAIMPIHLYGLFSPMQKIMQIAKKHHLFVVADASQAHGAILNGKMAGTIGTMGCFSFYPSKNLGAIGDAGMVITDNKKLAQRVRELRMYGEKKRFQSRILGINSRLDELQAAILRVKLKKLNKYNQKRIHLAKIYFQELENLPLSLPPKLFNGTHVFHIFCVQTAKRNSLRRFLSENGVETHIHSSKPTHLVEAFSFLNYKKGDFPEAEKATDESLFLPLFAELEIEKLKDVCSLVKKFFKK